MTAGGTIAARDASVPDWTPDSSAPDRVRLPFGFDPARLRADLDALEAGGAGWIDHLAQANYAGSWTVLPLRHAAGETHPVRMIYAAPDAAGFVDGPLLDRAPYLAAVMAAFRCPVQTARLMRLTPGSVIKPHRDLDLAAEWGTARIHVPITTNPGVAFLLNGTPVAMAPGEAWYLRLADTHAVANRGTTDRIHLVIDCVVDDWLRAMLDAGEVPVPTVPLTAAPAGDEPDDALARFRRMLAARPDRQARLGAIALPDAFVAEAVAVAAEAGIALAPDAVAATLRVAPVDVAGFLPPARVGEHWPPPGWLPARSTPPAVPGDAPGFDWVWFGPERPTAPFFSDDARRCGYRPFGLMTRVRTDLATLVAGAAGEDVPAPDGLVFHMSRCGSTLAAQMLAAVPRHRVLSEAEPVDAVVRWATTSGAPIAEQVAALRAVVAALGRGRDGARCFLKLDAWHGFALPLFRAAFPGTPWLFLHRDPGEVLVSLRGSPGIQSAPGALPAALIGFDPAAATSPEDYAARLFAGLIDRVLAALDDGEGDGMAVHYPDLVPAMIGTGRHAIPAHFGFVPTATELAAMTAAAGRDAKDPGRAFVPDAAAKRARVSPAMARAVETWLADRHAALLRRSTGADRSARA